MPLDTLVREATEMTDDQIMQVIAFARFLKSDSNSPAKTKPTLDAHPGWKRRPGILAGKIWMADDFDETPDCFAEYM